MDALAWGLNRATLAAALTDESQGEPKGVPNQVQDRLTLAQSVQTNKRMRSAKNKFGTQRKSFFTTSVLHL